MQPGARLGPYEIVALLGAGGMGLVYRARDTRLGRDVAIKVLPAEFAEDAERLRRFEREARATAALSHPNILEVHDVGTFEGVPYLVEELLEGESLKEKIERGALPASEAIGVAVQIARGLAAAHEKGIVHRDLKPANVFLTKHGAVKILDFGLAKLVEGVPLGEADTLTHAPTGATEFGRVLGTVAYMAPEQARGLPVDQRADVFGFGVVLYEMLAGQRPFRGATATDTVAAILKEEPAPLPASVPPDLVAVIGKCLAKVPEKRYSSGSEVLAALGGVDVEGAAPLWGSLQRSVRRHPWLAAANVVVALAVLALALDAGGVRSRLLGRGNGGQAIRMAVLPFANLSGDPDQEYLSDGLTQEMIAQLGRLHPDTLSVIARTSVMRYKKTETPIDQIGRELGVEYVLEGSAQREGSRVRITAELIRVRGQTQLWADSFEREMSGILALQSDVARNVASALALKLLPAEQTRLATTHTVNPEAYEAYLKGMQCSYRLTPQDLGAALEYFELALKKDPNYAPAYAGVSFVWIDRQQAGYTAPREAGPKAKAAALKAIELDSTLGEGHAALAAFDYLYEWDWAGAEAEFKRAIELNPNFPDVRSLFSHYLMIMKRPEEAMAEIQRALQLDPLNELVHIHHGFLLESAGRYDEAIVQWRNLLRTSPQNPMAHGSLSYDLFRKAKYEESLAELNAYYAGDREMNEALTQGYAQSGYRGAMIRAADLLAARGRTTYVLPNDIAQLYAIAGEKVQALEWLEKGFEARDPNMPYLDLYPEFETLRSEPRFQALLRRMNLPTN
ncbi:MAG: protein kinase [Thermoanaerobaculaceae bacterium]